MELASKLPYLNGMPRQEQAEMYSKIRELEINMLDLKSSMERRISQLVEEIPTRLQRELKNIESRDTHLWKDSSAK
jgi:phage terminase Nu1 subunit (DNA packaging protein)